MAVHSDQHPLDLLLKSLGNPILPKPRDWWTINERIFGQINALASFRGRAVATNGILVLLLNEQDMSYTIGHWEWFIADETSDPEEVESVSGGKAQRRSKKVRAFVEFDL